MRTDHGRPAPLQYSDATGLLLRGWSAGAGQFRHIFGRPGHQRTEGGSWVRVEDWLGCAGLGWGGMANH
eukprot:COSAG02_NODE_20870_length_812_cov_2.018233_1_plen_68_part_01